MSLYVVILNGPPNSGKDASASFMSQFHYAEIPFVHSEMKHQLVALTKLIWNVSDEDWEHMYTRENKELPNELLGGLSPRNALIQTSEEVIKPVYGRDYFGIAAARSLQNNTITVFSDGGFVEELLPIVNAVGVDNVLVIRIHREGCDFSKDSRDYLPDGVAGTTVDLYNDGSLEDFEVQVLEKISEWLRKKI